MEHLFIHVLNISITASFLVLAIIIYRLFAKKAPRWVSVLLWGLVGVRLLLPFELESEISLVPSKSTVPQTITHDRYPALDTGFGSVDEIVNPILSGSMEARPEYSANPMAVWMTVLGWIWLGVMVCMLLYMAASFIYLRIKTRVGVKREDNVYLCDYVKTPFILGVIRPRICLPSDISDKDYIHVVAHEEAHIKRLDHIWKPLGFLLLSVYWFNPLLWVAYVLLCRDIESACDERVISELDDKERAEYSEALLSLGIRARVISACPLAFGEVSVRSRVSAIARYKRPAAVLVAVSVTVVAVFAACFLTYKKNEAVKINTGIWYAQKVVGALEENADCDGTPRLVFTEGGDVLVESDDLSDLCYVRLGKMNRAYISESEYERLFEGVKFREGYSAADLHGSVKTACRITPSISSGVTSDEVYLLRSDDALYMGYRYGERITELYEMCLGEALPTYVYNTEYVSDSTLDARIVLDTELRTGRVVFGSHTSYEAYGKYTYENGKITLITEDDFALKLVFLDVGDALIFSERESNTRGLSGLFDDGATFHSYYRYQRRCSDTKAFDVNGDGAFEVIFAYIGEDGTLYYMIHRYKTLVEGTVPFTAYDHISFEEEGGSLYLDCEYSDKDMSVYRYRVTLDGEELIFTEVDEG